MGAFFTNVQVFIGERNVKAEHGKLVEKIKKWLRGDDLVEVSEEENAERIIVIGPSGPGPWILIFDNSTEEQDLKILDNLAMKLSSILSTYAASILVHDSDIIVITLFHMGNKIDRFINTPDLLGEEFSQNYTIPNINTWKSLLSSNRHPTDLERAWNKEKILAEEILEETAEVFGWDMNLCQVGFNYLSEIDISGLNYLRFGYDPQNFTYGDELPVLEMSPYILEESWSVGQKVDITNFFSNIGGNSIGFSVILWGPAVEENLVDFTVAKAGLGKVRRDFEYRYQARFTKINAKTGEKCLIASFPKVKLKKRITDEDLMWYSVEGLVLSPGLSKLYISIAPEANFQKGEFAYAHPINITPKDS